MNTIRSPKYKPKLSDVEHARSLVKKIALHTPLSYPKGMAEKYGAKIGLKREDLQVVRSYKLRGAYYKIATLTKQDLTKGVVCASAGNHAQGVAYACQQLKINGHIFMPLTTPQQKVNQVRMFGGKFVEIQLVGDTFDDSLAMARAHCKVANASFIHPFDDPKIIEGQGTVALEILEDSSEHIDYLILPVGGGGLAAGVSSVFRMLSPTTKIIGVEPAGAASMSWALQKKEVRSLQQIDKFVDGAAVKQVGKYTFDICQTSLDRILTIPEGLICKTMLQLYNEEAMVVEPAGALSISALQLLQDEIKNKIVVCVVSGGNNDIARMEEIQERALLYEELKHYFIVNFPQREGALREFLIQVLGPQDDIVYFQYMKKNNRIKGPAMVGIELKNKIDLAPLVERMKTKKFFGQYLNHHPDLFHFLV
ncbi:threonine ammonia-lyase IlvA [Aureispira anguillae]|uniref:L-threonine dehydratase n=1 Tax=Aureispira anguillae TaxID=2864201 RepID=A0A916DRM0_9BACT|nr:threonine ammonia-lyase IlvA [Aureispira anguillae]BDS11934.1 threonine ammonia-lyase IlvA [Aureispira anguillae]